MASSRILHVGLWLCAPKDVRRTLNLAERVKGSGYTLWTDIQRTCIDALLIMANTMQTTVTAISPSSYFVYAFGMSLCLEAHTCTLSFRRPSENYRELYVVVV